MKAMVRQCVISGLFLILTVMMSGVYGCGSGQNEKGCSDNAADDPTLAQYVCDRNIASDPGKLKLLPIGTAGNAQTRAYAEYVPSGYDDECGWPCIIFLHGDGELGDGKTESVMQCFNYSCLPGMIYNDTWDSGHRFVVLAPQFASNDDRTGENVNAFVQFAKANYKIDIARIYFTAVSGGGIALGRYLSKYSGGEAAAALPVSCYLPPIDKTNIAKWKHVPLWMICGASDTTVKPDNLVTMYNNLMSAVPPPPVTPRLTLYTGVGHDSNSANKSYAPELNDNKMESSYGGISLTPYSNIYDWMLRYHR